MRLNKIASLESRIARLESRLAGFFYKAVDPEMLDFIKRLQKRAPDYYPGIQITLTNNPNVEENNVVLEIEYPDSPQFFKGTFSDEHMYEPLPSKVYMKLKPQQEKNKYYGVDEEVAVGYYSYVLSTDPYFRKVIARDVIDLDMGKFLVLIRDLNKTVFEEYLLNLH